MRYVAEPSSDEIFLTQKFKTQIIFNFPVHAKLIFPDPCQV